MSLDLGELDDPSRIRLNPSILFCFDSTSSPETGSNPLISEVESTCVEPEYTIVAEPADEHPSFLVAEISLPKVVSVTFPASCILGKMEEDPAEP
ncbi:hypothetical protein scyTo_0012861 [Scyliorhinus torazame]|uniref:Uncharacterized protein n=1 Tax=Scyliorhinus torazame TaxID=75743 RepID=A0A401NJW5_SCYTO|nr:hypothetical protein [Scyliorhinus torazame]